MKTPLALTLAFLFVILSVSCGNKLGKDEILIKVAKNGDIRLNHKKVETQELQTMLEEIFAETPMKIVHVMVESNAKVEILFDVCSVINSAHPGVEVPGSATKIINPEDEKIIIPKPTKRSLDDFAKTSSSPFESDETDSSTPTTNGELLDLNGVEIDSEKLEELEAHSSLKRTRIDISDNTKERLFVVVNPAVSVADLQPGGWLYDVKVSVAIKNSGQILLNDVLIDSKEDLARMVTELYKYSLENGVVIRLDMDVPTGDIVLMVRFLRTQGEGAGEIYLLRVVGADFKVGPLIISGPV